MSKIRSIKEYIWGIIICVIISVVCWFLGHIIPIIGGPVFAIIIGMLIAIFYKPNNVMNKGISFCSKKILQYAVILLGFGLNLTQVLKVGQSSLPIIISTILTSLIISFVLYKLLNSDAKIATLVGVGSSICGGSAIAATAPVIDANDEEIAQSISVVFLFNVLAALIFPTLGGILGMSNSGFGLFAGTAVNDTSSVTAVATAWDGLHVGANTLEIATIVKLTRTLAIIPITLVLSIWYSKKNENIVDGHKFSIKRIFPMFIIYFVLASVITTICTIMGVDSNVFSIFKEISKFFIIMAMVAIGLNTNIIKLIRHGGKPIFIGFCCWISITLVSVLMQILLGLM